MGKYYKIKIGNLKPGMRVAKIVENQFGANLVTPGMILDTNTIVKLINFGVKYITIYKETEEKIKENINSFTEKYEEDVEEIKGVFNSVKHGNRLNQEKIREIVKSIINIDTNRDIVNMLTQVREVDEYTYIHSVNVGLLAMMFARWLNLPENEVKILLYAGLLHDIGKARVPSELIQKKGKLTKEEYSLIKKHTIYGYEIVKKCKFLPKKVGVGVLLHHERIDASGYPLGLEKGKIPFIARVLAIVDTYDAMISDRVYKNHRPPFEVFRFFEKDFHKYDISLSKIFINQMSQYYIGEEVKLSNGQKGKIVFVNPNHLSNPIIKIDFDYIDLYQSDLEIDDVVVNNLEAN